MDKVQFKKDCDMYAHIEKTKENKSRAAANNVAQQKDNVKQGFGFVDNRPETVAQRKLQEMINNSPQVAQLAYDASVKRGAFNMVGENHKKTAEQREKEKFAAAKADLFYYTENELFTLKDGLDDKKADPTNLRILFALAKIKEAINSIVLKKNKDVVNERETILYVIGAVEGDIQEFQNERLKKSYLSLKKYISQQNVDKSLETIQDMVFEVDHRRLGSSEGLAVARSEAMHEAANGGHTRRIMWMVGSKHTDDIHSIHGSNRDYTMLKQEALDKLIS
jgi:hypothetical protein